MNRRDVETSLSMASVILLAVASVTSGLPGDGPPRPPAGSASAARSASAEEPTLAVRSASAEEPASAVEATSVVQSASAGEPDSAPRVSSPAPEPEQNLEVFQRWMAFGSGCRARSEEPGDVTMERRTLRPAGRVIHRARFHLDHYRLTTEGRGEGEPLDFARECAIRVQLVPPAGQRIARVTARARVVSTKSESVRLTVLGELKIGPASIGRKLLVHEAGAPLDGWEDVFRLVPGTRPEEAFPRLACAQSKLVGFDATWIAERPDAADQVFVELSGDRVLDLDAELAGCD